MDSCRRESFVFVLRIERVILFIDKSMSELSIFVNFERAETHG